MRPLALLLLAACSSLDHGRPIEGWPELRVVEHRVPHAEMRTRCAPWVTAPEACAVMDFDLRTCTIWLSHDFPFPGVDLEHEREHCAGKDHMGASQLRDALVRWQRSKILVYKAAEAW